MKYRNKVEMILELFEYIRVHPESPKSRVVSRIGVPPNKGFKLISKLINSDFIANDGLQWHSSLSLTPKGREFLKVLKPKVEELMSVVRG